MSILKFSSEQPDLPFFKEIIEEGYHIFSLKNAAIAGYYPNEFPGYPGICLNDLKVGDEITVRVFFRVGSGENIRADGGYVDLEIEGIAEDNVMAVIRTELPAEFALGTGDSIEIYEEEILHKAGEWER